MNTPSARSGRALEMEFIMASGCPAEHPEEGGGQRTWTCYTHD